MLILSSLGGTGASLWAYESADAGTVVDGDGYFSDGDDLGMKVGDIVFVTDTDTQLTTSHVVLSVTAGGAADLGDGTTIGDSTDSD
jgi:hypothetical protein